MPKRRAATKATSPRKKAAPKNARTTRTGALPSDEALLFLLRAGEALAASLDYRTTLSTLVREAVPAIADWCAVDLLDEQGNLQRLAVAHRDAEKIALVREIESRYPQARSDPTGSYARVAEKRTDWFPVITDEMLAAGARNAEHLRMIRSLGLRSFVSVPLVIRDRAVGLFTLATAESGREYTEADVEIVEELARRASMAIDHARAHRAALETAERLEAQAVELETQTQELREAEAFTRGIVESIADPMVVYDSTWHVRYENAAALQVFRRSRQPGPVSMLGRVLWEEYPDLDQTAFGREMRRAMDSRVPLTFVEQRRGSPIWNEVRCYPLPDGGLAVVWKDITEQKRAELTLRFLARASDVLSESLEYDTTLANFAQLIVPELADWCSLSVLEGGQIRTVTVAHADSDTVKLARELLAEDPIDPAGDTQTARVIRSGKPQLIHDVTNEMIDRSIDNPKLRALLKQLGVSSVLTVPLSMGDRVLGAMSLISMRSQSRKQFAQADVSLAQELARRAAIAVEHARLYREAVSTRAAAEEANAAKTHFLARMSHELRTPLNAIGGYAELLLMGIRGPVTDQQRSDLDRIRNSQNHLLSLINDVLNYAKVEAGRLVYDMGPVSLADALASVEALFGPQLSAKRLRYTLEQVTPDVFVLADAERLQQILLNLMSNAVKFTPDGGAITIAARVAGDTVEVLVHDTGRGIPADRLETIFEPFVQLPTRGEMHQGTGLGLAISRDLARGMGGDLAARSDGQGATFVLRLTRAGHAQHVAGHPGRSEGSALPDQQ